MEPCACKGISLSGRGSLDGFSLLELMVCLSIIAIALVAALGLQSSALSQLTESRFRSVACMLAQNKIAEAETADPENLISDSGDFGDDYPGYRWDMAVEDAVLFDEETSPGGFKRIDLTISIDDDQYGSLRYYRFDPGKG